MNNRCVTCCPGGYSRYFELRGLVSPLEDGQVLGSLCKPGQDALPSWKWKRNYSKTAFLRPIPCTSSSALSRCTGGTCGAAPRCQSCFAILQSHLRTCFFNSCLCFWFLVSGQLIASAVTSAVLTRGPCPHVLLCPGSAGLAVQVIW